MKRDTTKADLHSHGLDSDGTSTPEQIVVAAKASGLQILCMTDHHSSGGKHQQETAALLDNAGILPILAAEYSTADGHLLCYGVNVPVGYYGMYPRMQDVIDDVNARGGACITPHPYYSYKYMIADGLYKIRGLAAIEVLNGQLETKGNAQLNAKARKAALDLNMPMTGASDAHTARLLGATYTEFEGSITTEKQFIAALHSGNFVPRFDRAHIDRMRSESSFSDSAKRSRRPVKYFPNDDDRARAKSRYPASGDELDALLEKYTARNSEQLQLPRTTSRNRTNDPFLNETFGPSFDNDTEEFDTAFDEDDDSLLTDDEFDEKYGHRRFEDDDEPLTRRKK